MKLLNILCLLWLGAGAVLARPKNVIVVLVDDMGQTDLGCYGNTFYETPNIDKLAESGMRFTQASSACTVCSPTRAALLTGKYPARLHITDWIPGHARKFAPLLPPEAWVQKLPPAETTLAELFSTAGYATAAIGKWHLGNEDNYPEKHGFQVNVGGTHRGQPPSYFSPYGIPTLTDGPEGEFLTDRECDEACKFMEKHQAKPFFIYMPHYAVHTPIQAKKAVMEKYKAKQAKLVGAPEAQNYGYAALVESVDDSVGKMRKKLEELKLWDETVFIFTSDNGGLIMGNTTRNIGLRAGKGSAYEGGTRIPLLVRWPGVTKEKTVCETPVITPDVFSTLAKGCGLQDVAKDRDGADLSPLLAGGRLTREAIYWHYPHYHPGGATPYSAVRCGEWKMIHFYEDGGYQELFNLARDPEEQKNLAPTQTEQLKKLKTMLEAHLKAVGAQLPRANPEADAAKDAEPKKKKNS